MIDTSDIVVGQFVRALKGRDKGSIMIVSEIVDDRYVKVVDGKDRPKDNQKLKNICHLQVMNRTVENFEDMLSRHDFYDSHIRKIINGNTSIKYGG